MIVDWKRVIAAGFAAGLVFIILEMLLVGIVMGTPFGPPRMMAAMVMGTDVLPPPPPSFDLGILIVAMIVHFVLSIVLAAIYAFVPMRFAKSAGAATALGVAFGLIVYLFNFFVMTEIFPWFAMARNWITTFSHLIFGLVLGLMLRPAPAALSPAETTA